MESRCLLLWHAIRCRASQVCLLERDRRAGTYRYRGHPAGTPRQDRGLHV